LKPRESLLTVSDGERSEGEEGNNDESDTAKGEDDEIEVDVTA